MKRRRWTEFFEKGGKVSPKTQFSTTAVIITASGSSNVPLRWRTPNKHPWLRGGGVLSVGEQQIEVSGEHRGRRKVQRNYHIFLGEEKNFYSVPWQYTGKQAEVFYTRRTVEIYGEHKRVAIAHLRPTTPLSDLPEHIPRHQ